MSGVISFYRRINSSVFLRDIRFRISLTLSNCLGKLKRRSKKKSADTAAQTGSVDPEYIVTMDG
jgi:hypothetical protein